MCVVRTNVKFYFKLLCWKVGHTIKMKANLQEVVGWEIGLSRMKSVDDLFCPYSSSFSYVHGVWTLDIVNEHGNGLFFELLWKTGRVRKLFFCGWKSLDVYEMGKRKNKDAKLVKSAPTLPIRRPCPVCCCNRSENCVHCIRRFVEKWRQRWRNNNFQTEESCQRPDWGGLNGFDWFAKKSLSISSNYNDGWAKNHSPVIRMKCAPLYRW